MQRHGYRSIYMFVFALILVLIVFFILRSSKGPSVPDYSDGIVVLNTNKSVFVLDDEVQVRVSVLSKDGSAVCSADLVLQVLDKDGNAVKSFSTSTGSIEISDTCSNEKNSNSSSDYILRYRADKEGEYTLKLIVGERKFEKHISVVKDLGISIERTGATRISPSSVDRYPMTLRVYARDGFRGQVTDLVPEQFSVVWQGEGNIEPGKISWDVEIKAGETKELIYEYNAPQEMRVYSFGKASLEKDGIKVLEESNQWQVTSSRD